MRRKCCSNCNAPLPGYAHFCPECWQPIDGLPSPELYEQCLYKATGRDWIAVAISDQCDIVFMERCPVARLEFRDILSNENDEPGECGWRHSAIRDYLNGPYLASLPKWVVARMVAIDSNERTYSVADKVSVFSEKEIIRFMGDAPKNPEVLDELAASRRFISLLGPRDEYVSECPHGYYDDCYDEDYDNDPLSRWEEDGRQYSSELYHEWVADYEKAVEAHNYALYLKEAVWEQEYDEEERKREEREKAKWNASMVSCCDFSWTRECRIFSRIDPYPLSNAGVMPVICLSTSRVDKIEHNPVFLHDMRRILGRLTDEQFDAIRKMESEKAKALQQFIYGEDHI